MNFLMLTSFKEVTGYIGYILLAILILLIMITAHEAGHYFAGKLFGFGIEEFAIGFGPKLFSRKKKDGEVFFTYFVWYGIGRFFIEGLRTDSLYWGTFKFSQVFAVITALLGLISLYNLKKDEIKKRFK